MLVEFLVHNGILLDPEINNKWHLLEFLTRYYCRSFSREKVDQIFETVLQREMKVSTGLGGGVAIPHARSDIVKKTGVLFVRSVNGLEWESLDGGPVHFLFLVIGPTTSAEEYLVVLSHISKILSRKDNRNLLLSATHSNEIVEIMKSVKERASLRS